MFDKYQSYDVFLSYSHLDEHIARELVEQLEAAGLSCFLASKNLSPGEKWEAAIRDAIRGASKILLLITPRSKDSSWVALETGAAWMADKELIPLTQFVDAGDLGDIASQYQLRPIETTSQKESLVQELRDSRSETPLSFTVLMSKIESTLEAMRRDRVYPEIVIASGRDGAVCGGMFADRCSTTRFKLVNVKFFHRAAERKPEIDARSVRKEDVAKKTALVVEWARRTGSTFELIEQHLLRLNVARITSFAYFWSGKSKTSPDYFAFKQETMPLSPWSLQKRVC